MVVVTDDGAAAVEPVATASSSVEVDIAESVPRTIKVKIKHLMTHLKPDLAWTDSGKLIHDSAPAPGNKTVNLVHDVLRKRINC